MSGSSQIVNFCARLDLAVEVEAWLLVLWQGAGIRGYRSVMFCSVRYLAAPAVLRGEMFCDLQWPKGGFALSLRGWCTA